MAEVKTPSVLFVCTANVCRSPMAVALFKRKLAQARQVDPSLSGDWRIESAGTWAREGESASYYSQKVMLERGLDLRDHRSHSVSLELLRSFNLILVMEQGHKEALRAEFPGLADRIFLVSEMVGQYRNIHDPISGTITDYQDTANELERIIHAGFDKICQLACRKVAE